MTYGVASYRSFRQSCRQQVDLQKNERHHSWVDVVPLEKVCGTKLMVTFPKESLEDRLVAALHLHPISSKLILIPKTTSQFHQGTKIIFEEMPDPMVQHLYPYNSIPQGKYSIASVSELYLPYHIGKSMYQHNDSDAHSLVSNQQQEIYKTYLPSQSIHNMQLQNMRCQYHRQKSIEKFQSGYDAKSILSYQTTDAASVYSNGLSCNQYIDKTPLHFGGDDMSSIDSTRSHCIELIHQRSMIDMQLQILHQQEHIQQLIAMQQEGQSNLGKQYPAQPQQHYLPQSMHDSPLSKQHQQEDKVMRRRSDSLESQSCTSNSGKKSAKSTADLDRLVQTNDPIKIVLHQGSSSSAVSSCSLRNILKVGGISTTSTTRSIIDDDYLISSSSSKEDDFFVPSRHGNTEKFIRQISSKKENDIFVSIRTDDKDEIVRLCSSCYSCGYGLLHEPLTLFMKGRKNAIITNGEEKSKVENVQQKQQIAVNAIPKTDRCGMSDVSINTVTNGLSVQRSIRVAEIATVSGLRTSLGMAPYQHFGQYSGPTIEGKVAHGAGTICFTNGDTYTGHFFNGEMHGTSGLYTWVYGDSYKGDFWHNMRHGKGKYLTMYGRKYIGVYQYDKPNGIGVLYNKDGSIFHRGQWLQGKPVYKKKKYR